MLPLALTLGSPRNRRLLLQCTVRALRCVHSSTKGPERELLTRILADRRELLSLQRRLLHTSLRFLAENEKPEKDTKKDAKKFEWDPFKKDGPAYKGGEDDDEFRRRVKAMIVSGATLFAVSILLTAMLGPIFGRQGSEEANTAGMKEIDWNTFKYQVLAKGECTSIDILTEQEMAIMHLAPGAVINGMRTDVSRFVMRPGNIRELEESIREAERSLGIPPSNGVSIVYRHADDTATLIFLGLMVALSVLLLRHMMKGSGGASIGLPGIFDSFRKANFRLVDSSTPVSQTPKIKFKVVSKVEKDFYRSPARHPEKWALEDVAGLHEAKVEVIEFVDYLKKPEAFTKLGAKLPKGALLLGPPGCGKTLLAKAVATETSVPFLAMNGTDFIEMIGGLGAARIRDLFKEAKKRAPCIIYIDEIDAVGKKRAESGGRGFPGGGEEDQTLNQLLVEMDGMDTNAGVILFASTNRADILDKALLRPGRFDRHITIDLPTLLERREHFELYLEKLRLQPHAPIPALAARLAALTPGMSGADIANVCNEAAIHAASLEHKHVESSDLDAALERIIADVLGPEKRSRSVSSEERTRVAYHESGHALVGWLLQYTDALLKVSIVPRTSAALGFAAYNPGDRKLFSKEELNERMCMALGGRAAENLVFGNVSSGAQNDLEKVTRIAYDQIKVYGMSEHNPPLSFPPDPGMDQRSAGLSLKPYSKRFAAALDQEARELVGKANARTEQVLADNRDKLEKLAQALLSREVLDFGDVQRLIGPPTFAKKTVESVEHLFPTPDQYPEP